MPRLIEISRPTPGLVPINVTGTAKSTPWISLAVFRRLSIYITQGEWAGGSPAVTLEQSQDTGGVIKKALALTEYYQSTTSDDTPVKTAVVSDTFNLPNQANTLTIIEIHSQDLDLDGYKFVRLNVASPGSNADLLSILCLPYDPSYSGKPSTTPSVLS